MEHTLNKSFFIILLNLTCFLGKKSSFHTCTPGTCLQEQGILYTPAELSKDL